MPIVLKRVYDDPEAGDGFRVLVDRLWPRGLRRDDAAVDLWLKDAAPSTALRRWFGHDPERWGEFRKRYRAEFAANRGAADEVVRRLRRRERVTFLFASRDTDHTHAAVLKDLVLEMAASRPTKSSGAERRGRSSARESG